MCRAVFQILALIHGAMSCTEEKVLRIKKLKLVL